MRLDNYSAAPFEALEPIEAFEPVHRDADVASQGAPVTPAPEPVPAEEAPSQLLSEMARQPPAFVLLPDPGPRRRLARLDDGDRWALGQRERQGRFERFEPFERESSGDGALPGDMPPAPVAPPASAPAPAPVEAAAPAAAPAAEPAATPPATAATIALPLGPAVSPGWLNQREAALKGLRAEFEAAREAARHAPPADVANAAGGGWVPAPTDHDGNPINGAVFVPDAAAAAAAPESMPAWMLREGVGAATPQGQWLSFDDGAYEQAYRERLAARPEASAPLTQLAALYGQPVQQLLGVQPGLWTLATHDHAINAGAPPQPGVAMGDAAGLGQLDLYLADPFITQLREQLGGTPAAPASGLALEQQRLYGSERVAALTQLSQAMTAVRQTHAAAMQAARDGGGAGWIEVPMQFGTDPETGWPTGVYETVSHGDSAEILRDANGAPVLAKQRVFDEALFTNAWLAEGASSGGLAQEAFARFYGQAHSHIALQQDNSESGGPPRWVSQPGLDNPHVGLGDSGVLDGDLIALELNHAPRLNNDAAIGFDPQLGWVTSRDNLYEHRSWLDKAVPIAMVAFVSWATAGAASAAGWGAIGSAAAAGAAASFAGGVINGNLSLKGVLIGAVSGALTAGLTPGLTNTLKDAGLGAAAGVAARMTVQGGIQALLGGKFKDGAIAGFASGLADLTNANIKASIDQAVAAGTMSTAEAFAARSFNTVLSSAIRAAASPDDPAHAFASAWLDGLMRDNLPAVQAPAPVPADGDEVQTFPVPAPPPAVVTPLPAEPVDLSVISPREGESDSQFTVRLMREIYGPNVDLNPAGEHDKFQVYRDENGRLVISDGTGLNPPVDPKVTAAFEALLAQRMQQLNAIAAVQRSQAFSDWAAANNRPVVEPPETGVWGQRIPVVADVRDFLLSQIDQAVSKTSGSGQVALEGLRIAVEAITPETYGDVALNELGAGVVKAALPLAGVLKAAAVESRLGKEVGELLQAASREGGDVAGHLLGNAAEAEAREAGRVVIREVPGKKSDWNAALSGELKPNATYVLTNGHTYTTDTLGRVVKAEGTLNPATVDRNAYQQLLAGRVGGDGYDGGHLIGTLVGGAGEKINLVAQLSSVNRGEFRVMEKSWAEAMQAGKEVRVEVVPIYAGTGQVPSDLIAKWWINGVEAIKRFPNTRGG